MAVKVITKNPTIPAGGSLTLAEILGRPVHTWIGSLAVRAGRENTYDLYWTDEAGQRGGFIGPGEAVTMDFGAGQALIQNIVLTGTAGDTAFVSVGMNRDYFTSEQ